MKKASKITVIALIVAMVGVGIGVASKMGDNQLKSLSDKSEAGQTTQEVVAVVNGQELTSDELDQYAGTGQLSQNLYYISPEFAQVVATTEAGEKVLDEYKKLKLDNLIEQELLKQEVEKSNLTEEEKTAFFNDYLAEIKTQNDLTDEELMAALNQQGLDSIDQFKEHFFATGGGVKILKDKVTAEATVADAEIQDYYDANAENFKTEEGVQVTLEEVEESIKSYLLQEKQQQIWKDYVAELLEKAEVKKLV